jgi:hypothetical protein
MDSFPWEVNQENLTNFFGGPHLFAALYRVYRGAYYGQGFQFCGNYPKNLLKEILDGLNRLPLEVRRIILSKIWENGRQYNVLCVNRGDLFLPLGLHFLFAQYGRVKQATEPLISKGCGAWNGKKLYDRVYVFEYGTPNLRNQVLIPDFVSKDPYRPTTISFGLLCL